MVKAADGQLFLQHHQQQEETLILCFFGRISWFGFPQNTGPKTWTKGLGSGNLAKGDSRKLKREKGRDKLERKGNNINKACAIKLVLPMGN